MELEELLEYLSEGKTLTAGTEAFDCMHRWSLETQRLTQELNTGVHDMEEIREYMCRITGRTIDESFRMFLYTSSFSLWQAKRYSGFPLTLKFKTSRNVFLDFSSASSE